MKSFLLIALLPLSLAFAADDHGNNKNAWEELSNPLRMGGTESQFHLLPLQAKVAN